MHLRLSRHVRLQLPRHVLALQAARAQVPLELAHAPLGVLAAVAPLLDLALGGLCVLCVLRCDRMGVG